VASKARTGHSAGCACHKRWSAYGKFRRHTPKAGAVWVPPDVEALLLTELERVR